MATTYLLELVHKLRHVGFALVIARVQVLAKDLLHDPVVACTSRWPLRQ